MSWQQPPGQQPPPTGFYPGQQGPQPGFFPGQSYPSQGGGYPPQGGYPPPGGYVPQGGYPPQAGGYPGGFPPQPGFPGAPGGAPFAQRPEMYGGMHNDAEDPLSGGGGFEFTDKSIRRGFIRKVYSILMLQLLVTFAFISVFVFHTGTKQFAQQNRWVAYVAMGVTFVTMLAIACCGEVRRKAPMNFILLGIFTLAESFLLGVITSFHQGEAVFMAVGITAVVCLALTLFAFQTKVDFTMMGGVLLVAAVILLVFGIVAMFFPGKTITLVYASLGALLFSIYLIYDTQMMMGGNHKYSISPEEYIFAALNLYMDIVNIFIYILTIIGASSKD
ncbi:protein lifeguard 1-like [Neocloeon triangulifer]|uniref:protein lifeguard 1-like n=1 Tax=Neocloeon triangulifer TaxID=2078957 RepID=UPI00286F60D9|nr:protein lifeguard 1-like [Neocloeon triangulifer]